MNLAADIAALLRDRPRPGDDDQTRAAWFHRKAAVFNAIADEGGHNADEARTAADQARAEAERVRRGDP